MMRSDKPVGYKPARTHADILDRIEIPEIRKLFQAGGACAGMTLGEQTKGGNSNIHHDDMKTHADRFKKILSITHLTSLTEELKKLKSENPKLIHANLWTDRTGGGTEDERIEKTAKEILKAHCEFLIKQYIKDPTTFEITKIDGPSFNEISFSVAMNVLNNNYDGRAILTALENLCTFKKSDNINKEIDTVVNQRVAEKNKVLEIYTSFEAKYNELASKYDLRILEKLSEHLSGCRDDLAKFTLLDQAVEHLDKFENEFTKLKKSAEKKDAIRAQFGAGEKSQSKGGVRPLTTITEDEDNITAQFGAGTKRQAQKEFSAIKMAAANEKGYTMQTRLQEKLDQVVAMEDKLDPTSFDKIALEVINSNLQDALTDFTKNNLEAPTETEFNNETLLNNATNAIKDAEQYLALLKDAEEKKAAAARESAASRPAPETDADKVKREAAAKAQLVEEPKDVLETRIPGTTPKASPRAAAIASSSASAATSPAPNPLGSFHYGRPSELINSNTEQEAALMNTRNPADQIATLRADILKLQTIMTQLEKIKKDHRQISILSNLITQANAAIDTKPNNTVDETTALRETLHTNIAIAIQDSQQILLKDIRQRATSTGDQRTADEASQAFAALSGARDDQAARESTIAALIAQQTQLEKQQAALAAAPAAAAAIPPAADASSAEAKGTGATQAADEEKEDVFEDFEDELKPDAATPAQAQAIKLKKYSDEFNLLDNQVIKLTTKIRTESENRINNLKKIKAANTDVEIKMLADRLAGTNPGTATTTEFTAIQETIEKITQSNACNKKIIDDAKSQLQTETSKDLSEAQNILTAIQALEPIDNEKNVSPEIAARREKLNTNLINNISNSKKLVENAILKASENINSSETSVALLNKKLAETKLEIFKIQNPANDEDIKKLTEEDTNAENKLIGQINKPKEDSEGTKNSALQTSVEIKTLTGTEIKNHSKAIITKLAGVSKTPDHDALLTEIDKDITLANDNIKNLEKKLTDKLRELGNHFALANTSNKAASKNQKTVANSPVDDAQRKHLVIATIAQTKTKENAELIFGYITESNKLVEAKKAEIVAERAQIANLTQIFELEKIAVNIAKAETEANALTTKTIVDLSKLGENITKLLPAVTVTDMADREKAIITAQKAANLAMGTINLTATAPADSTPLTLLLAKARAEYLKIADIIKELENIASVSNKAAADADVARAKILQTIAETNVRKIAGYSTSFSTSTIPDADITNAKAKVAAAQLAINNANLAIIDAALASAKACKFETALDAGENGRTIAKNLLPALDETDNTAAVASAPNLILAAEAQHKKAKALLARNAAAITEITTLETQANAAKSRLDIATKQTTPTKASDAIQEITNLKNEKSNIHKINQDSLQIAEDAITKAQKHPKTINKPASTKTQANETINKYTYFRSPSPAAFTHHEAIKKDPKDPPGDTLEAKTARIYAERHPKDKKFIPTCKFIEGDPKSVDLKKLPTDEAYIQHGDKLYHANKKLKTCTEITLDAYQLSKFKAQDFLHDNKFTHEQLNTIDDLLTSTNRVTGKVKPDSDEGEEEADMNDEKDIVHYYESWKIDNVASSKKYDTQLVIAQQYHPKTSTVVAREIHLAVELKTEYILMEAAEKAELFKNYSAGTEHLKINFFRDYLIHAKQTHQDVCRESLAAYCKSYQANSDYENNPNKLNIGYTTSFSIIRNYHAKVNVNNWPRIEYFEAAALYLAGQPMKNIFDKDGVITISGLNPELAKALCMICIAKDKPYQNDSFATRISPDEHDVIKEYLPKHLKKHRGEGIMSPALKMIFEEKKSGTQQTNTNANNTRMKP